MQSIALRSWPPARRSPLIVLLFFDLLFFANSETNRDNEVTSSGVLSEWQQVTVLASFEKVNALSKKSTEEQLVELPNRSLYRLGEQYLF